MRDNIVCFICYKGYQFQKNTEKFQILEENLREEKLQFLKSGLQRRQNFFTETIAELLNQSLHFTPTF